MRSRRSFLAAAAAAVIATIVGLLCWLVLGVGADAASDAAGATYRCRGMICSGRFLHNFFFFFFRCNCNCNMIACMPRAYATSKKLTNHTRCPTDDVLCWPQPVFSLQEGFVRTYLVSRIASAKQTATEKCVCTASNAAW